MSCHRNTAITSKEAPINTAAVTTTAAAVTRARMVRGNTSSTAVTVESVPGAAYGLDRLSVEWFVDH